MEFALVAAPFLAMMFAVLDVGLVFMLSTALENATIDAARGVRTGRIQGAASEGAFKSEICDRIGWLSGGGCEGSLSVDVRTFAKFQDVDAPDPISNGAFNEAALTYCPGGAGSIVLVRTYYKWPLLTPLMNSGLEKLEGMTVVTAGSVFKAEPYSDTPAEAC